MWKHKRDAYRILVTLNLAISSSAFAQNNPEQECIFAAAQQLPKIPGLVISASRTKVFPDELQKNWQLQRSRYEGFVQAQGAPQKNLPTNAIIVEIEARAAAQDTVFSFVCFYAVGLPSVIHPMHAGR